MNAAIKPPALCLFTSLLLSSAGAQALSLMDAQEKQKQPYKSCQSASAQLLGEPDLDGDGQEEPISLYAFDECPGKTKAVTFVTVFHKTGDSWAAAKGDGVLSDSATLYSLESAENGIITLKNVFDDAVPPVRFQYAKGKLKRLK